jgi:hypothetical protein
MHDEKIEAVRSLIVSFRRSRRSRSEAYPKTIKAEVVRLIGGAQSIPKLGKQIGLSNVMIYQWQKEASAERNDHVAPDPFIEIPVESFEETQQISPRGILEIKRNDLSAILRIECAVESMDVFVRAFLGGIPVC